MRFLWFLFLSHHSDILLVFGERCNFLGLFFVLVLLDDLADNILSWICFFVTLFLLVLLLLLFLEGLLEVFGGVLELAVDPLCQIGLNLADLSDLRHELGLVYISGKTHILSDNPFLLLHLYKSYYIQNHIKVLISNHYILSRADFDSDNFSFLHSHDRKI